MTNSIHAAQEISRKYIAVKYGAATPAAWRALATEAAAVLTLIKAERADVYANGPRVHGARQQSQLDLLAMREQRMCAVFDNAMGA